MGTLTGQPADARRRPVGGEPGWSEGVAAAASVAANDRALWALALVSFVARGGLVLLVLPMLTVPSPVQLSILFRGQVGEIGRGDALPLALGVGLLLAVVAIGGVLVAAWSEVAQVERVVSDPETDGLRRGRRPRTLTRSERRALVSWTATIGAIAILPVIAAAAILVERVVTATTAELIHPTATDVPLPVRVLGRTLATVGGALAIIVAAEVGATLASRRLLVAAFELLPDGAAVPLGSRVALQGAARAIRHPARVLATACIGWLVLAAAVGVSMLLAALAFEAAREAVVAGDPRWDAGRLVAAALSVALMSGAWLAALALTGAAAAFRAAAWTSDALRR
jgi:hypothetical protein